MCPVTYLCVLCFSSHQTLKQETEALWFEFELQYAQLSQRTNVPEGDRGGLERDRANLLQGDRGALERDRAQLLQQWRSQQICLQNRCSLQAGGWLLTLTL